MKVMYVCKIVIFFIVLIASAGHGFANSSDMQEVEQLKNAYPIQVPFIENKGHIANKEVIFFASSYGGFGAIYVEKNGMLVYKFHVQDKPDIVIKEIFTKNTMTITPLDPPAPHVIAMFKKKMNIEEEISNYYRISWGEIYENISLEVTANPDRVEKFLTVLPGGDPENIKITLKGATGLKVEESGKLELITELGSGKFNKPIAFQVLQDKQKMVDVSYLIHKGATYGFKLGTYDNNKPLIIRF